QCRRKAHRLPGRAERFPCAQARPSRLRDGQRPYRARRQRSRALGSARGERGESGRRPALMYADTEYYIAAVALAFRLGIIGVTRLIENRRQKNPMPHLVPTTPFMLFGAIVVVVGIAFALAHLRASNSTPHLTADEVAKIKAHVSTCWVPPPGLTGAQGLI